MCVWDDGRLTRCSAGKDPVIQAAVGKVSMSNEELAANIRAFLEYVVRNRPLGTLHGVARERD